MDMPIAVSLVVCDAIAIGFPTNKLTMQGVFDNLVTATYPAIVPSAAVVLTLQGVIEPVECRFFAVAYPDGSPLGVNQLIGVSQVPVQPEGRPATTFIVGGLVFPATQAGRADIVVHGNGVFLASRRVDIMDIPPQQLGGSIT